MGSWNPDSCFEKRGEPAGCERQPCPRGSGPRRKRTGQRARGWGRRPLLHGRRGGRPAAATRRLQRELRAGRGGVSGWETCGQAALLSGSASGSSPPSRAAFCPGAGARRAGSLSLGNDSDCEGYHTNPRQSSFRTCKNRSR